VRWPLPPSTPTSRGFACLRQAPGEPPGTFQPESAAGLDERVAFFRERAGARITGIELNMLVQQVVVAEDPTAGLREWAARVPHLDLSPDQLADAPQVPAGTVEQIADRVRRRRERYGFSYFAVFGPAMETFAPVLEALRGN
jgi:hypothetical protein